MTPDDTSIEVLMISAGIEESRLRKAPYPLPQARCFDTSRSHEAGSVFFHCQQNFLRRADGSRR